MKVLNQTKKALMLSIFTLVLCLGMLISTTYAWFTDSVSSEGNIIQTGKLDVNMQWADGKESPAAATWKDVEGTNAEPIFNNNKWEPGHVEVRHIKISNEGTLALKYQVLIQPEEAVSELVDVIDVYYADPAVQVTDRAELKEEAKLGTLREVLTNLGKTGAGELKEGEKDVITLALKMQESANNDYQNLSLGSKFTVLVLATQLEAEEDSFGSDYDKEALLVVNSAIEFKAALESGQSVQLGADITLDEPIVIPAATTTYSLRARAAVAPTVIDLNGKTINAGLVEGSTTKHVYAIENRGNLVLTGNGTINTRGVFNYGNLVLENGTINAIDGDGGYAVRSYAGASFVMNGGTLATTLEDDHKVNNGGYDATTVRVDEGATFTMNSGTINNICDYTFAIDNHGETIINGGTITSVHSTVGSYGTLTINGGSLTCNGLEGITAHALVVFGGETTINGGKFDGKDNYNGFNVDAAKDSLVNIYDGTFLNVHSGSLYGEGTINVYGGTYFDKVKEDRVAFGYKVEQNADGKWVVVETEEKKLENALSQGGVVTLDKDLTLGTTVVIPEGVEVTLDLNGKTITGTMHKSIGAVIKNEGVLTIKNGTISSTANNGGSALANKGTVIVEEVTLNGAPNADGSWPSYTINNTGKMTLNSCKITSYHGAVASYNEGALVILNESVIDMAGIPGFTSHGIYTYDGGKVIVNGGTYANKATDQNASGASVVNGNVEIKGGTFTGRIENYYGTPVIKGGTFNVDPKKYVVEGHEVVKNTNDTWTVEPFISYNEEIMGNLYDYLPTLERGDILVLPEQTYITSGTFTIPDGVTIKGAEGAEVIIRQISSAQDNIFNCEGDAIIENITFESNRKGYAINGSLKEHNGSGDIIVRNCKFVGLAAEKNWAVYKNLNGDLIIENCTFDNYNNAICGVNNGEGSVTVITGCTFTNINGEAIGYVSSTLPTNFEDEVIQNNTGLTEENVIGY